MVHEELEVSGHLLDSLTLPKILDRILAAGGGYEILEFAIGRTRREPSRARLTVSAEAPEALDALVAELARFGAHPRLPEDAALKRGPRDGIVPEDFYVTTNLPTQVRLAGRWVALDREEMDCAIVVARDLRSARPVRMAAVRKGALIVCGRAGVRVGTLAGSGAREPFSFMASAVSAERPALNRIAALAAAMREARRTRGKILVVAGPAVVHTGGAAALAALIRAGWVNVFFGGNALAAHDIELSLYGTSLGLEVASGRLAAHGHENHLRAINGVRAAGSIRRFMARRSIRGGIMHALLAAKVPFVLAGSIRDDGPLPDVITDTVAAQAAMRALLPGVAVALIVATQLHGIAVGNLLSANVVTACVDVSAEAVTKLVDRGTAQATGIVMDSASFLVELARRLEVPLRR